MIREKCCLALSAFFVFVLFILNLFFGSVDIPAMQVVDVLLGKEPESSSLYFIVMESRMPQALTALLCGAALAGSGLMLQTVFRNPLAGPSILGIDSGASLGVALVMLLGGGGMVVSSWGVGGFLATTAAAFVGAMGVMALLLFFSTLLKSDVMLLIAGMMISYVVSSVISLLNFFATAEGVHSYMVWGMGSFGGVSMGQLPWLAIFLVVGIMLAISVIKPLNALLLGYNYAKNLGINVGHVRMTLLLATGLLSATVTAFCGPISFLGLAVPHMARFILHKADHRLLMPLSLLVGSTVALFCNLLCVLPGNEGIIPLGIITPLLGVPVVLLVLVRGRR